MYCHPVIINVMTEKKKERKKGKECEWESVGLELPALATSHGKWSTPYSGNHSG